MAIRQRQPRRQLGKSENETGRRRIGRHTKVENPCQTEPDALKPYPTDKSVVDEPVKEDDWEHPNDAGCPDGNEVCINDSWTRRGR